MQNSESTVLSTRVTNCQICNSDKLEEIISLGHLPQVNVMQNIGENLKEEQIFPAEMLLCTNCSLVQLSHVVDPNIIFPPSYAYTSRTTKILRENFTQLAGKVKEIIGLTQDDLVIDIGSNDGTLLSNFSQTCRVLGVEPTDVAQYANNHGIQTVQDFFDDRVAYLISKTHGLAKLITATNVFAHIDNVHSIVKSIKKLMDQNSVFISESHYLLELLETRQYDTIYHEHLRYYSLTSLKHLFDMHGLEIFHAELIPTHGGSIRVYTAQSGTQKIHESVGKILLQEKQSLTKENLQAFKKAVVQSKTSLYALLSTLEGSIGAIGAPSRAATLVSYVGLNEDIIKFVLEAPGSSKIGKYMPGTKIPILEETVDAVCSVDNLLLLSWHIAEEIMPKLRNKGFTGKFIMPLPSPRICAS